MIVRPSPLFERLLEVSPLSRKELETLINTAPNRYKEHTIEKRNGRGLRLISQPTAELKFFQRYLVKEELRDLPIHPAATAYRKGMSIRDHARPHAGSRYLLKLDFKDFFPSLGDEVIKYQLRRDSNYSDDELFVLCQLLCRRDRKSHRLQLSIGAPSSPFVSNYLMHEFDGALFDYCQRSNLTYTRYADDIALSTSMPHVLDRAYFEVERLVRSFRGLGLVLNTDKTVNVSTKFRRALVGLTLSNDGCVSVGREQKRLLRSAVHKIALGKPSGIDPERVRGMLAFIYSVDPRWVVSLCERHGLSSIEDLGRHLDSFR